jgi:hypothetical protein
MESVIATAALPGTSTTHQRIGQQVSRKSPGRALKVTTPDNETKRGAGSGIKLAPNARGIGVKRKSPKLTSSIEKRRERQNALRNPSSLEESPHKPVVQDGSSGGREGRQFTVGNVGNNGMIYLRYVVRRAVWMKLDNAPEMRIWGCVVCFC